VKNTMTFSIVARCPKTLALGVAVSTAVPAVGSVVPHVKVNVGAIATQAQTNVVYGTNGLLLIEKGEVPEKALKKLLAKDKDREKRQVTIMDVKGRKAAFTGKETEDWKGHLIGEDCIVAGNMLTGSNVVQAMCGSFKDEKGTLAVRLLKALEAGQDAGGDRRGRLSAALLVADSRWIGSSRPLLDLRVDAHSNPVTELRRVYAVSRGYFHVPE
jgi:uncharacterized Ntn-hydrolase superfamily protein